jgi:crotonobetainyl-CoA:carnitine CoA-transferase CaiB-like acyl-CoA transferase
MPDDARTFMSTKMPLPLAGIRVIELAQNLAGPFCGGILGQLGADVIKVERPGGGDDARGWGPPVHGDTATTFMAVNKGKRSITLDLKDEASLHWLKDYVREVDVVVQNLRPGSAEELGLGPEDLLAINPRLVYATLSAFGHKGPKAMDPGYEPILQGFSGMMMMNGEDGGPPTRVGMQVLDLGTGLWAALGVVAALHRRTVTGRGGTVDASLLETALGWMSCHFAGYSVTGRPPRRHLSGNPNTVVFQAFDTATKPIMIAAANDRLFARFCEVLGRPELGRDERFKTNRLRVENKPALLPVLEDILRSNSCEHWIEVLEAAKIPCGPINDMKSMDAEPQVAALGIIQELPDRPVRTVHLPLSLDGERLRPSRSVPAAGEHTDEIVGRRE